MANYRRGSYDFVIDSSFSPFTMQEMLVPFTAYKDAFEKSEEAYLDLSDKADKFKYLSETLPEESKARQIYEGYANDLKAQAEDLARNGLGMGNRRALTGLRRRYSGEIGRLQQVDALRRAQIKEQNELRLKDPTRLFSRRADLTDFDAYLENPDLSYESYSGAMLAQQVGTAASAIAKSLRDYGNGKPLDGFTKTWLQQHGYSAAEVAQAIQNPASDKTGVLNSIVEQAVQSSKIPEWADAATLNQAYQYARQGLWNAVGQTSVATYTDEAAKLAAQEAKEMRMANYNHTLRMQEQAATLAGGNGGLAINPINIYNSKEADQAKKYMSDFAQYFTVDKDGQVKINNKGLAEYRKTSPNTDKQLAMLAAGEAGDHDAMEKAKAMPDTKYTDFRKFIDSLGGAKYLDGKVEPGNIGNLWVQYNKDHDSSRFDATKSTEFDYRIYDSQQKDMKAALQTAARGTELQEVDFDRKTNSFKPSGESLSMEDLNDDKVSVLSTRFSPYGSTVMIKDKNGKVHRYEMPVGINPTNEHNRDVAMQKALQWQNVIVSGQYKDASGNTHQLTPEEFTAAQQMYKQALQEAYLYHSQLGVSNKVKEQEFNPYGY